MESRTRERAGLVIFFALVLLGGAILVSYFATGLTWTVYATMLDDTVGNMGGYTAVVFPGTVEDDDEGEVSLSSDAIPVSHPEDDDIPAVTDTMGLRIMSYYPGIYSDEYTGVYISDVRDLYEKKDAEVVTIDAMDVLRHPQPQMLRAGGKAIGVFGVDSYVSRPIIEKTVKELEEGGAEAIICVTRRMALLSQVDGIDIVVLTEESDEYPTTGYRLGDTLLVQSPKTGEAGVLLLSSNNVASARSIDAL